MGKEPLDVVDRAEHQELLVGTWLAIAIIADELIESGHIERSSLLSTLTKAEKHCRGIDSRHRSIGAVRRALEALRQPDSERKLAASSRRASRSSISHVCEARAASAG
jgi:hypothetical protein